MINDIMMNTSCLFHLPYNTFEATLVPFDCFVLGDLVTMTDLTLRTTTFGDSFTSSCHTTVEIHAVNTNGRVVFDTKIDMFADAETKVTSFGEVTGA